MSKMIDKGNDASAEGRIKAMPQGIFVLGMHRSGTSACTRVLNLLGCALSDELLGAGEGNETGHWEPVRAIAVNDEILASAGSSHEDWGPINADWRNSAIRSTMVQRVSEVIADHAKLGPLFAIKDPRICRLADVWLEAAADAEIEPLVVLMLRNPVEVAASLETRDLMANGYSDLLWLRHVLDAEHFSRGQKRVICQYDELMSNWQRLVAKIKTELGIAFPRSSPKTNVEVSQFLSHSQRHHIVNPAAVIDNPTYSAWLRQTFQIMLDWSERGEQSNDYQTLDGLRAEMGRAYDTFAPLLLSPNVVGAVGSGGQLRDELKVLREESERRAEVEREAAHEAQHLRAVVAQREAELAERVEAEATQAEALQSKIERLNEQLALRNTSDEEAQALRTEIGDRIAELAHMQAALDNTRAEADAENQHRAAAEDMLREVSRELHEQQLRSAELAGQVSSSQSALIQRQEELAQLLSQLYEVEQVRVRAEMECEQERVRRSESEKRLASANAEIGSLQASLDEVRLVAQQRVDALTTDLARLSTLLLEQENVNQKTEAERQSAERRVTNLTDELAQTTALLQQQELAAQADRFNAEQRVDKLANDMARLTVLFNQQEVAARKAAGDLGELTEEARRSSDKVRQLSEAVSIADASRLRSEQKLGARFDELARLAAIASAEAARADASEIEAQWLRDVRRLEESLPRWWSIMPQAWRQARAHRRFRRAGLFDADAYLAAYPDVAANGMDPVRHYIMHGMAEGRIRPHPS